jgi:tyrosine-protein phosphatase YwqE
VCLVASDAHDLQHRPPLLSKGYHLTVKLTDTDYADHIFYGNAVDLLENNLEGLVKEDE